MTKQIYLTVSFILIILLIAAAGCVTSSHRDDFVWNNGGLLFDRDRDRRNDRARAVRDGCYPVFSRYPGSSILCIRGKSLYYSHTTTGGPVLPYLHQYAELCIQYNSHHLRSQEPADVHQLYRSAHERHREQVGPGKDGIQAGSHIYLTPIMHLIPGLK